MTGVVVLGAGKIGHCIAQLLARCGDFRVTLADLSPEALKSAAAHENLECCTLDAGEPLGLRALLRPNAAVISALSYQHNPAVAAAVLECGGHYFDLTEDVGSTAAVREIAASGRPDQIFMPQCGLAPGFISIAGHSLARQFDQADSVRLRVGALPLFPTNELKYNLTWSTDGLINEYCNPCWVIHEGVPREVLALEGLEQFSLDGVDYEAFHTSGGLGTLWETLSGQVRNLDYKTVRYGGHRELMSFLINGLRLRERRPLLREILENALPVTHQDVVLIFCTVTGMKEHQYTQITDARKIYRRQMFGQEWSAIQLTTAAAACAALDLLLSGAVQARGFVRQEEINLDQFLGNRFGRLYSGPGTEPILPLPFSEDPGL